MTSIMSKIKIMITKITLELERDDKSEAGTGALWCCLMW